MPNIDFSRVEGVQGFSPIPDGKYLCRLVEVKEAKTRSGDEMWPIEFEVLEGDYKGRRVFDNMVFSKAALKRAKLICASLGLDVSGELDLTPDLIRGRTCLVTVASEEYQANGGMTRHRNTVPFNGYEQVDTAGGAHGGPPADSADGLPF